MSMIKRRSSKKSMNFNKYVPWVIISAGILSFLVMVPMTPTGEFTAAGKEYSSYVDYYKENPTSVKSSDFNECIKITKVDARWPKRNYYKVGSKKFKYGSKWRPAKSKTKAMRKAKTYASTEATSDGVNCWKYGKVVGIGKRGCMKVKKTTSSSMPLRSYEPVGKGWKEYQKWGSSSKKQLYFGAESKSKKINDLLCVLDEWGPPGANGKGLQINKKYD